MQKKKEFGSIISTFNHFLRSKFKQQKVTEKTGKNVKLFACDQTSR